jgi:flagellar biosynthesis component FlhA
LKQLISIPDLLIIAGLTMVAWGVCAIYPAALKLFIGILMIVAAVLIKPAKNTAKPEPPA